MNSSNGPKITCSKRIIILGTKLLMINCRKLECYLTSCMKIYVNSFFDISQ